MSDISSRTPGFNLWHDPWIRVLDRDGNLAELGISECLERAADFHILCDPSPLVVGGTHRLLVAIIQSAYNPCESGDLVALLDAKHFPPEQRDAFESQYAGRFELFHHTQPFLQAGDVPLNGSVFPREKSMSSKAASDDDNPLKIEKACFKSGYSGFTVWPGQLPKRTLACMVDVPHPP